MMRQNLWMVYLSSINNNNEAFLQTDGLLTFFQGIVIGNKPPSTERLCRILPTPSVSLVRAGNRRKTRRVSATGVTDNVIPLPEHHQSES